MSPSGEETRVMPDVPRGLSMQPRADSGRPALDWSIGVVSLLLLVALFYFEGHWRRQVHVHHGTGRERRGAAIPCHHDRPATGRTGRATDCGPFAAAEDCTQNRSTDGGAANLARTVRSGSFTIAIDRFGAQRHLAPIRENQRVEPYAEPGWSLHFSSALDHRHRPNHARACRNHHVAL